MSSPKLPNLETKFFQDLEKQLRSQTFVYQIVQILLGAIFPTVIAILVALVTTSRQNLVIALVLILVIIIHITFLIITIKTEKPLTKYLLEFEKLIQDLAMEKQEKLNLESFYSIFYECLNTSLFSLEAMQNLLNTDNSLEENFAQILDPWLRKRTQILSFYEGDALYNIAVYLWSEEVRKLKIVYRRCDDRLERRDREWEPGVGHVGQCFSREDTQFCEDLAKTKPNTKENLSRREDLDYYRSIIAEPIKVNKKTVGVLIVTSSQAQQFDENIHILPVRTIAGLLALVYLLGDYNDGKHKQQ